MKEYPIKDFCDRCDYDKVRKESLNAIPDSQWWCTKCKRKTKLEISLSPLEFRGETYGDKNLFLIIGA